MMEATSNGHSSNKKNEERQTEYEDISEATYAGEESEMLIPAGGDVGSTQKRTKRPTKKINDKTNTETNENDTSNEQQKQNRTIRNRSKRNTSEKATEKCIKYSALFLLVAQMVGLVLLMRYSRTVPRPADTPLYLASTAVFIMEVMKLIICLFVIMYQSGTNFLNDIRLHIFQSPMEILKLCVPSFLYTIQNNLLYLALTNLDAATYQVCYQLKILTTAVFSAILLDRKFSATKWLALVILTIGVAIVEISGSGDQHMNTESDDDKKNRWIGLIAVVCAACTSGFSGVYFEKILKGSNTSLWIRNVQMGLPSVLIAYITVYVKDAAEINVQGFLGGYTGIVWTVVIVQAVGGLIVATVVKYADNVLKVFATSFSIVVSCIISAFMFDFHPSVLFLVGASLVVSATVMYSSPERKVRRKTILPITNKTRK